MPTNQNAYNSRVTDEALEKRFRDTFRSQGGAELVDDLYASGVIVPVVDFTQAATGDVLAENLQTAWDFSTGFTRLNPGGTASSDIITTAGFWQIDLLAYVNNVAGPVDSTQITLSDGLSSKTIYQLYGENGTIGSGLPQNENKFVVFVRSNDVVNASITNNATMTVWYRQIATVNGDLVNPTGFTSS